MNIPNFLAQVVEELSDDHVLILVGLTGVLIDVFVDDPDERHKLYVRIARDYVYNAMEAGFNNHEAMRHTFKYTLETLPEKIDSKKINIRLTDARNIVTKSGVVIDNYGYAHYP